MHRRAPETVVTPIAEIQLDAGFVYDPKWIDSYAALVQGKIRAAFTRLPANLVHSGFYKRKRDGSAELISNLKETAVPQLRSAIRAGVRPIIDLQWSPHVPGGGGYVCADDEVTLAAYRAESVNMVPCRILRPIARPAQEAAIWIEKDGSGVALAKSVPPAIIGYASYLGDRAVDLPNALHELREIAEVTAQAVRDFHQDGQYNVHYHEMLHAVSRRHARILDSMLKLVELGRKEHALALCRMAYEAFLNFYLDWLAPQFIGPRLQLLSALRSAETGGNSENSSGWQALKNFPGLFENASEKARISPLGSNFHNLVYPSLSLVAHQSYRFLEFEASTFDGEDASDVSFSEAQLTRCLDVLSAALLTRIRNDVGLT